MVGMINELSPEELEKIPKEEFGEDTKAMEVFVLNCYF